VAEVGTVDDHHDVSGDAVEHGKAEVERLEEEVS
jgi:hypothetical protein